MELSPLDSIDLGDGTKLGEVPALQGLDLSGLQRGEVSRGKGRMFVRFYKENVPEIYATDVKINPKTGATTVLKSDVRQISREMVEIVIPGEKNSPINAVADDYHRNEFWQQYKAYREGKSAPLGVPIEQVDFLAGVPAIVTELKVKGCFTLEQLAEASDVLCGMIADGFLYRQFAQTAVRANLSNKNLAQVNALQAELATMKKQMSQLLDMHGKPAIVQEGPVAEQTMSEVTKPRRGRPPKVTEE